MATSCPGERALLPTSPGTDAVATGQTRTEGPNSFKKNFKTKCKIYNKVYNIIITRIPTISASCLSQNRNQTLPTKFLLSPIPSLLYILRLPTLHVFPFNKWFVLSYILLFLLFKITCATYADHHSFESRSFLLISDPLFHGTDRLSASSIQVAPRCSSHWHCRREHPWGHILARPRRFLLGKAISSTDIYGESPVPGVEGQGRSVNKPGKVFLMQAAAPAGSARDGPLPAHPGAGPRPSRLPARFSKASPVHACTPSRPLGSRWARPEPPSLPA